MRGGAQPRDAVGLYRVSTAEQGQSGLGLEVQRATVRAFVDAGSVIGPQRPSSIRSDRAT